MWLCLKYEERLAGVRDALERALKIKDSREDNFEHLLHIYGMMCGCEDERGLHGLGELLGLALDVFLLLGRQRRVNIILSANKQGMSGTIQPTRLAIPLFDAGQRRLPRKVEYKQYSSCVVAHEGQHAQEFMMASQIPN